MTKARLTALALFVVGVGTALTVGAVSYDGTIGFDPDQEWAGIASAVQDNYTQFGNQILSDFSGSELDELYVRTDGNYLYVAVTGNLQENGNAIILLMDTGLTTGQNTLKTEIAPITVARSSAGIPRRRRMPSASTAPVCSWLARLTRLPMS